MADTCGEPLDCDDIQKGMAAIIAASYVRLADGPNGELRTARRTASCNSGGGGGGQVNFVGFTSTQGVSAAVDSSDPAYPVIVPIGVSAMLRRMNQVNTFTQGQALKTAAGGGGAAALAQGNSAANAEFVGFYYNATGSVQGFDLLLPGSHASIFSGLTAGSYHYLSPSVAGGLTTTPNAYGPVLKATSTTSGYVLSNAAALASTPLGRLYVNGSLTPGIVDTVVIDATEASGELTVYVDSNFNGTGSALFSTVLDATAICVRNASPATSRQFAQVSDLTTNPIIFRCSQGVTLGALGDTLVAADGGDVWRVVIRGIRT